MGIFHYKNIKNYLDNNYKIAVETGTCLGYSTDILIKHFKKVHTIELDKKLYDMATKKFKDNNNVYCHHGDSKEVLKQIIPLLNQPTVFYLDAHWSGDNTTDWEHSAWKGYDKPTAYCGKSPTPENQVPLLEELEIINSMFKYDCIIYIDDADKFDKNGNGLKNKGFIGEDWSHLTLQKLKSVLTDRTLTYEHVGNQIIIILKHI